MMGAGRKRYRVTLRKPTFAQNEFGEPVKTYVDGDTVWAAIEPISGREFIANAGVRTEYTVKITINYRRDVTADYQIVHGNTTYELTSPPIPDAIRVDLMCPCRELIR